MEELIAIIAKEGIVAGGFIYMLYYIMSKFTVSQQEIVTSIREMSSDQRHIANTLSDVTGELRTISEQMSKIDERLTRLEGDKK